MSDFPPVIFVDLVKSKLPRRQPYRWVAKSGDNYRKLATSGEWYSNKNDAVSAIHLLFGDGSNVYLREAEQGNELLRFAVSELAGHGWVANADHSVITWEGVNYVPQASDQKPPF
jgi:hypothetical protein